MNREIKFRIRDKDTKKIIGYEFIKDGEWWHTEVGSKLVEEWLGILRQIPEIREQYTGSKDRKKVEIYEGDILEVENKWEVVWVKDGWRGISGMDYLELRHLVAQRCEVIGNIYENSKLLK